MSARTLGIVGVLVAAAAIAAWLWLRPRDPEAAPAAPPAATAPAAAPGQAAPAAPALPDRRAETTEPDTTVHQYQVGDVEIRDHRSGSSAPRDLPPNMHAPGARMLPSSLTHAIATQVRTVMMDCAQGLPREARGPKARLEGTIEVAIHGHQLSITSAEYQLRDVFGPALDATKDCIAQRSIGLAVAAGDEEDLDKFSITVSNAIP